MATGQGDKGAGDVGPLRAARRTGLIDQVITQLRGQIVSGVWGVGSRIPTEAELAQSTGTSRNTVREAVQSLVHAGLLERRQGSGTYVLAVNEFAGAVGRSVSGAHRTQVLEVRRTLEAGAARLAALRHTPEDVARMREAIVARNVAWDARDIPGVVENDLALHRLIAQAAHNDVLTDLYEYFVGAMRDNIHANTSVANQQDPDEHVALIDAIEAECYLDELLDVDVEVEV